MILVTGSSGHIGNVLVRALYKEGASILVMTKTGEIPSCLQHVDIAVCKGDLRDKASVDAAVAQANQVYHLAGMISISSFASKTLEDINVEGTRNIVEACLKHNVERLVYTSSVHALREAENGAWIREQERFDSDDLFGAYAKTKAKATQIVLDATQLGLNAVICFPSGVMGPFDYRGSEAGRLIKDYAQNKLPVYIDGAYNFVDVRDVVDGLQKAMHHGRQGEGYILAGEKMTMSNFFDILSDLKPDMRRPTIKIPIPIAIGSAWIVEILCRLIRLKPMFTVYAIKVLQSNCNISSDKAVQELAYNPRSIRDCIQDTLYWLQENKEI